MMTWLDVLAARHACGGLGKVVIAAFVIIPDFLPSVEVPA